MLRQIIRAGNLSWSSYLKTESIKQVPQFPLRIYFKSFTSKLNNGVRQFQLFCPWMKSYGLTIQTKSLQKHFHKVLFIQYVVLNFESVDEILSCKHSNEPLQQYFHMVLFIQYVVLPFESVDEILQCNHSNEPLQQYFHMVLFIQYVVLTFESVDQILQCDHSIVIQFLAERSLGTFCFLPWCIFSHKVRKIRLTFTLANSGSEEMSKLVLQSKMGRTVSVSQTPVYAQYEIGLVRFSYVEKIPDDQGILFVDHPRFCRLMKTPNHTVDIAVSTGWLGKNHKNREWSISRHFPDCCDAPLSFPTQEN